MQFRISVENEEILMSENTEIWRRERDSKPRRLRTPSELNDLAARAGGIRRR